MLQVGIRRVEHHADEGDGLERRTQATHVRPQLADVVGGGQDGTADIDAARRRGVVVRIQRGDELHGSLAGEEIHHLGAVVQEGVDLSLIHI